MDSDYSFEFLVDRIYNMLEKKERKIVNIPSPNVSKLGGRKSIFTNSDIICEKMNRKVDHFFKYICSELTTNGSINEKKQIILKGKYFSKQIKNILKSYIEKYVYCVCLSFETELIQENGILYLKCNSCLSKNSIKDGIKY